MTFQKRVVNATVRIGDRAQGTLIPGGFILTAAHCIRWNGEGAMALGETFIEEITTKDGAHHRVTPIAVDPVTDIAILGPLDYQEFGEEVDAFEEWCENTTPIPLSDDKFFTRSKKTVLSGDLKSRLKITPPVRMKLSVRILSHRGTWIKGTLIRFSSGPIHGSCYIETESQIESGTSGGAVVDSTGQLVAVVSVATEGRPGGEKYHGTVAIASLGLPRWVLLRIAKEQATSRAKRKEGE